MLYQHIWKHRLAGSDFTLADGRRVHVADPGVHNHDAGPDFLNARIEIDGIILAGNVEIHVNASDWNRHRHGSDPAYSTVILHAVANPDCLITRSDGSVIPQLTLSVPDGVTRAYASLSRPECEIRCAPYLAGLPRLTITDWIDSLGFERMRMKARRVAGYMESCGNDREQAAFITVARALGFGLNSEPFEMLASSLPLRVLSHHSDNQLQLEALMFGQAAMLDTSMHPDNEYYQLLCREYQFLARKYGLRPIPAGMWRYARTRPQNFPHRRVALLAAMSRGGFSVMRRMIDASGDAGTLRDIFNIRLSGYWENHLSFELSSGSPDKSVPSCLGGKSTELLIINAAVPLLSCHAMQHGDIGAMEHATSLLESLPPERNGITTLWGRLGLQPSDAFRSQALLHLKKEYCDRHRCMECRFGHKLLRRTAGEPAAAYPAEGMSNRRMKTYSPCQTSES